MEQMQYLSVNGQTFQVTDPEAVRITAQTLTDEQKEQARQNLSLPILFAVGEKPYFAIAGMTWQQWCDCPYNTDGFTCDGTDLLDGNGNTVYEPGQTQPVAITSAIRCNGHYEIVVTNLFTYGKTTDYETMQGTAVSANSSSFYVLSTGGLEYLRCNDFSGNSANFFKMEQFENKGNPFHLSATFTAETEGDTAQARFNLRAYNEDGTQYTGEISGWTYHAPFLCHYRDGDDVTFTLPDEVATFKVGFLFNVVENDTGNVLITDITLTEEKEE